MLTAEEKTPPVAIDPVIPGGEIMNERTYLADHTQEQFGSDFPDTGMTRFAGKIASFEPRVSDDPSLNEMALRRALEDSFVIEETSEGSRIKPSDHPTNLPFGILLTAAAVQEVQTKSIGLKIPSIQPHLMFYLKDTLYQDSVPKLTLQ